MKRILIAAFLAVGIHGLLLGMEFDWLKRSSVGKPKHRNISLTLAIRQPQVPAKKVADKPPISPEKRPLNRPALPKKKIIPRAKKAEPPKSQKPSVQFMEKTLPNIVPQITSESSDEVEPVKMEHMPQAAATVENHVPVNQIIVEARPLYRINPPPKYPAMARRRGYTGHVVLEVLVGQDGSVADLYLFSSSGHAILDNAAISSVKTWIFEPGMRGEEKVKMWVRVPIRFELK